MLWPKLRQHHRKSQSDGGREESTSKRFLSWIGRKHDQNHRKSQSDGGKAFVGSSHSSMANSPSNSLRGKEEKAESSGTKTPNLKGQNWLRRDNAKQWERTHSLDRNYGKQKEMLGKSHHRNRTEGYLERLDELGGVGQQRPILTMRKIEAIRKGSYLNV